MKRYHTEDLRHISSMKELRYHKMRLELATEILEDKIEDNLDDIKRELSPANLLLNVLSLVWDKIIGRKASADGADNPLRSGFFADMAKDILSGGR